MFGAPGWNRTTTPCLQNRTSTTKDTRALYQLQDASLSFKSTQPLLAKDSPMKLGGCGKI